MRAACDVILVGAATVRDDNLRLLVIRRDARTAGGLPESPMKVTVTERVALDPRAEFLTAGDTDKLVYSGQFLAQHERPWPLDRWITRSHARLTNPGATPPNPGATPPRDERIAHVLTIAAIPTVPSTSAVSPLRGAARVCDRGGVARVRCCRVWWRRSRVPGGYDARRSRRRTRVISLAGAYHRPPADGR